MPSPFPGMDPYLERNWRDVHTSLVAEARRALNRTLPTDLFARVEERVGIESTSAPDGGEHLAPDVRVLGPAARSRASAGGAAAIIDAPFRMLPATVPVVERYVRIIDADGRLVSVVEFVSPSNKVGRGMRRFRRNRAELVASGVHFVEVDLVRDGDWRRLMSPHRAPPRAESTYRASVRLAGERAGYLYPISLRQPLPDVPVPLRPGDPLTTLSLQQLLTDTYDDGRYGQTVDYARPLDPPLDADDAAFAADLLAGRAG